MHRCWKQDIGRSLRITFSGAISVVALTWLCGTSLPQSVAASRLSEEVRELLRNRVEAAGVTLRIAIGEELIHCIQALSDFYEWRVYTPAWTDDHVPQPHAEALVRAISRADREGLKPEHYHLAKIERILGEVGKNRGRAKTVNPRTLVDLELLLTDAFLLYGSHLLSGRINPEAIDPEWFANRRGADFSVILRKALDSDQIEETLQSLLPPQPGYAKLRDALAHYREIAAKGGWPQLPDGPTMKKGDRGEGVVALRGRIALEDDCRRELHQSTDLFDEALVEAVRRFQRLHGLDADGVVGPQTVATLNVSAEERVRQIEVNMERWRWLPQDLGTRHVLVNLADFDLKAVESGQPVIAMKAIVGEAYRRTPVFSDEITYLVLNPSWNIPNSIAVKDKLPLIQEDPDYLAKQKIRVFEGSGSDLREIDPKMIDWAEVHAENFNFTLRQEPGPMNALGRVKFMFPNRFGVYIHDTPSGELFSKILRTFSSGCIRIEKPIDLADFLLKDDPQWTREVILAAADRNGEQTVRLPKPVPVHLLYWTAFVGEDGGIHFPNDIYGRDKRVRDALDSGPPCN